MELTEVLEFSRADMTRIVSLRLKEDREKRGTAALLRERVALKKKIREYQIESRRFEDGKRKRCKCSRSSKVR